MSKRKHKPKSTADESKTPAAPLPPKESPFKSTDSFGPHGWLLAGTMVLFVARPLFPSESVAKTGEGIPLVILSILLLAGLALAMLHDRRSGRRLGATDWAVLVLLVLHTIASVVAASHANARDALNMLWQWIGLGVGYFLIRQLVCRAREVRAIVAVMIALAVSLSALGLYQYFYDFPEMRAKYARNPDGMLRDAELSYPPGSVEREQFEQRLASREPLATFALTNSLAGYLATWLVIGLGVAASMVAWPRLRGHDRKQKDHAHASEGMPPDDQIPNNEAKRRTAGQAGSGTLALAMIGVIVGACLLLTKSRSAYVAVLVGLGLLVLVRCQWRRSIGWKLPAALALIFAMLIGGTWAVGGLDAEILSEAGKSLGYRVQYWQSTLAMIEDHPWLGCGPGQFQNTYTAYKLPEASEEVADPHNFLLEIWATAGTGAMLALLAVLACFGWAVWKQRRPEGDRPVFASQKSGPSPDITWIYGGALVGFLVAWPLGALGTTAPNLALLWLGLPLGIITLLFLNDWVKNGRLPVGLIAIGLIVLLTNLLAAGGIGFPGVAGTFWLLLALGLFTSDKEPQKEAFSPAVAWGVLIVATILGVACYQTAYRPVLAAKGHMDSALFKIKDREAELKKAAESDPLGSDPWKQLATHHFNQWRDDPRPEFVEAFELSSREALMRDPLSASSWHFYGAKYFELYKHTKDKKYLNSAINAYRQAVLLYPNNATYHATLALVLWQDGQKEAARREVEIALWLDDVMPHADKKLPPELRQRLMSIGF